ncbi:LOW QUALITY PROTEIN: protein MCM10 homolog [Notothenia coriiceps]|uniref:Protein MCM10 homolog n=1 Tax=Notothenia coriiceps TaxID=8208 RepID=A0A6I9PA85_9TELE|nr:PREDICTED: LOW QUALITY PROTEIN: protein MCM10 homolog [Notothenia coriiceps]
MDSEDDLDILTALLAESEGVEEEQGGPEQTDDLDGLFDGDDAEEEEYNDGVEEEKQDVATDLFGDVDDIENEGEDTKTKDILDKSKEDLQDELRQMQEKMQRLQQQLEASQKISTPSSTPVKTAGSSAAPKPITSKPITSKPITSKPITSRPITSKPITSKPIQAKKTKTPAAATPVSTPVRAAGQKVQESSGFCDELKNADSFTRKPRVAHPKASTSPEERGPLVEIKLGGTFQPAESSSSKRLSPANRSRPAPAASSLLSLSKDVAVEKYSGLRLRRPRVSSSEMDRKMADRRLIRLSQVPELMAREKLEDSDWVTFAVLVNKATPQSNSSGKTFSIWKLNDLHNLEVFVSLLLFGEVHKEHWKTETGTVIGLLNPNPLKQKEGYDGVSLTVDNPQKLMLLGEAQDYGTCKAMKKNGDPCSQMVNLFECEYCQYHVKAQYKQMSSKRAELQSAFSGKAPNKMKVKGKGGSLKERLCQDGFYYGGVSSSACTASLSGNKGTKGTQKTLDNLFVKGSAKQLHQAKRLALQSGEVSGCSTEFKSLLSTPTPGALQLKKHLVKGNQSVPKNGSSPQLQSITASSLLKEQKAKQREFLQSRLRRADQIQKKVQSSLAPGPSSSSSSLTSPKAASVAPRTPATPQAPTLGRGSSLMSPKAASVAPRTPATPQAPTLGRGFSEGEDILFFDGSPPPAPAPSALSLSAAKMAALRKLKAKGAGLNKEDPNAVKRKRSNSSEINARLEKNQTSAEADEEEEPAEKKKRDQLQYIQSDEFQKILNAKSRHDAALQAAEYQMQESYFDPLVKKEQMEEKMKGIREMKCRAVTCRKCKYTYFKPADRCVEENHDLRWHDATKRFFKCSCGQRAIALDRLPNQHCSNCGLFKWERDGMLKEKKGPKIAGELLKPRGEEHGMFLNSN